MRIAILALTPVSRDARVMRSAQALARAGHDVIVVGRGPLPEAVEFRCIGIPATPGAARQRLELVASQAPATFWHRAAHPLYWLPSGRRQLFASALEVRPDAILCNDWITLPIGAAVKLRTGAVLVYDSHEYAAKEHIQNWKWRLVSSAAVVAIERRHIGKADLVLTVSEGIADGLRRDHNLPVRPTVIRNMPDFIPIEIQPPNPRRQVLFHGLIRPERGLEELIDSATSWSFDGDIVIRGYGSQAYIETLRSRARNKGVAGRLFIEPPVSPIELIRRAASADIGYLALPGVTDHYEFALPNKLFEYLMAGLPVLATPRSEIRDTLLSVGAGIFSDLHPAKLADALNNIGGEDLVRMRRAALEAAKRLNWGAEQARLVDAIEGAREERRYGPSL